MVLRSGVSPSKQSSSSSGVSASSSGGESGAREGRGAPQDGAGAPTDPVDGVPAFLAKLWKLVDEQRSDRLICWGPGGNTFIIKDQTDFARKLLPLYYKHNNMASFIRQLNMYGFHKVISVDNGSLKCDNEEIQFSHPCFLRGHAYMLQHIKRKIASSRNPTVTSGEEKALLKPELMTKVLTDVKQMKGRQESLDARFSVMKRENEALWREVALLRQKHIKQQQIVNNLIQFLMSLVQPSRNGPLKTGIKRRYQLMINDAAHNSIDEVNRGTKCSRIDTDTELEEDDNDFILPEMLDVEGPIIHEVGEQEQGENFVEAGNGFASSSGKGKSVASTYSNIPESYNMTDDELDVGENISVENLENERQLLTDSLEKVSEINLEIPELLSPASIKKEIDVKGKGRKNSGKKSKQVTSSFPAVSQAQSLLPNSLFDSDETNSQDENVLFGDVQLPLSNSPSVASDVNSYSPNPVNDYELLNTVATGSYNPNINLNSLMSMNKGKNITKKGKKNKTQESLLNIKEEINSEDSPGEWNDMTVATLPNENGRPTLNRFNSVILRDFVNQQTTDRKKEKRPATKLINEDVDGHLLTMQGDIDSLRDLLCGDYSLDPNTLIGLFEHEDPFYGLSINPSEISVEKEKSLESDSASQLISYVPPVPNLNFEDFDLENDDDSQQSAEDLSSYRQGDDSSLNTPQVQLPEPKFPSDSID